MPQEEFAYGWAFCEAAAEITWSLFEIGNAMATRTDLRPAMFVIAQDIVRDTWSRTP